MLDTSLLGEADPHFITTNLHQSCPLWIASFSSRILYFCWDSLCQTMMPSALASHFAPGTYEWKPIRLLMTVGIVMKSAWPSKRTGTNSTRPEFSIRSFSLSLNFHGEK